MPNIAIINECNLRCPYCFADDMIENQKENKQHQSEIISLENFKKVLAWCSKGQPERIGIIGGEPTLHPQIIEILRETEKYCIARKVHSVIFTNGIHLDNIIPAITKDCFNVLVNVNSPKVIGEKNYNKILENLDLVYNVFNWHGKVRIGLNIYHEQDDYTFFYELVAKYKPESVRISFVAPTYKNYKEDKENYYEKGKNKQLEVCRKIYEISPTTRCSFDCNRVPACYYSEEEKEEMGKYTCGDFGFKTCSPVIDINPKLEAVRCFGIYEPVKITNFANADVLWRYFLITKDAEKMKKNCYGKCKDCDEFKFMNCYGGCLVFSKQNK